MAGSKKPNTVAVATQLAEPVIEEMGLMLWDVRYGKGRKLLVPSVFYRKRGGRHHRRLRGVQPPDERHLGRADPISQSYYLEVSSPGIERALVKDWHFAQYIGAPVSVR